MALSYSDIIKKCKNEWNCQELMDGANASQGDKIPFSSPLVNWATYGGVPRNRITEFFGEEGGGKSTSAVDICCNAVKLFHQEYESAIDRLHADIAGGNKSAKYELDDLMELGPKKVLYIDLEHGFDGTWANTLGVTDSEIDVMQPPDVPAEAILSKIQDLICTGELGLIVLDSIPSLVTQKELDKKYGESTVAPLAGLMTVFMRKIIPLLTRYNCTLILINQIRDNLSNPYVVNTPGGKAIKFYASLRLQFRKGAPVDFLGNELPQKTENPAGYLINVSVVKQKTAPHDRKNADYYLMCQTGINPTFDFAKLAIGSYSIIRKAGAWFTMCDPYTGEVLEDETGKPVKVNGLAKVYDYLNAHKDYFDKLQKYILNDINGKTDADTEDSTTEETYTLEFQEDV